MRKLVFIFAFLAASAAAYGQITPPAYLGECFYAAGNAWLPIAATGAAIGFQPPEVALYGLYGTSPAALQCDANGNLLLGTLPQVTTLPATCTVGQVVYLTTGTAGPYYCSATNTWTAFGSGGGGGGGASATTTANMPFPLVSSSTGRPEPLQVIALLGNSLTSNDTGFVTELCGEITGSSIYGPAYMQGHRCVNSTQISVDASNNVTLTIPNADSYFATGDRFTAQGNVSIDGGCLYDSYIVSSATTTSVTFGTAASAQPCAQESTTAAAVATTRSVVKFGENGATLDSWYASGTPYGFSAYQSWAQATVAAGQTPITIMVDAGLMTNSTRLAQVPLASFETDLSGVLTAIQATAVTPTSGQITTLSSYPFFITTGNTNACNTTTTGVSTAPCSGGTNTGVGGVYVPPTQISGSTQYVFPYGTTGSNFTTPATITSGSISAGANTVTINPCVPEVWGGPGDQIPTAVDASGFLRRNGNLIQVVLDTAGSLAQEVVNLTAVVPTGLAGLSGYQTCNISFTSAFAHAASTQVIATEYTADQQYTNWKLEIPLNALTSYPGKVKVIDTLASMGRQVNGPTAWLVNELHPSISGYPLLASRDLAQVSSYFNVPLQPGLTDPLEAQLDTQLITVKQPSLDLTFDSAAAAMARSQAKSINSGPFYAKAAIDPAYFYPKAIGRVNYLAAGTIQFNIPIPTSGVPTGDVEAGDQLYHSDCGSWQPTNMSTPTYVSAGVGQYTISGTQPASGCATGARVAVMGSYFVDAVEGAKFLAHPLSWPLSGVLRVSIANTSTTNKLVLTLQQTQNPYVIGGENLSCGQISILPGDWMVIAGNATNAYGTAGTSFVLPASGSWNGATCTWTDTSSTNYGIYSLKLANVVQQFRAPDAAFNTATISSLQANVLQPTVGVTLATTPTYSTVTNGVSPFLNSATGGNCANGTTYTFGAAWLPTYWGTDYTHAGPLHAAITTYNPASGSTNKIGISMVEGVVPFGYTQVYYLQILGTYYAMGNGNNEVTTCPSTGGGLIAANLVDNGSSGLIGPGAATWIPASATAYNGVATGGPQLTLVGATGTITGTALTATCDSGTATVTGAVVGHPVAVSSTTGADVGGAFNLRASVTSTNTVTVYVCGTGTPASLAYNVTVF